MTSQERLGRAIIEGRRKNPHLSAHEVHDALAATNACTVVRPNVLVSANGNGASH